MTLNHENYTQLVSRFIDSRRQGLSPQTITFYNKFLIRARKVVGTKVTGDSISHFLKTLTCTNGGKHGYYRALRCFYNWLYSPKSGYCLNPNNNPILDVDAPNVERKILPSLTTEQVSYLIDQSESVRDKAIISLFADSGLRLMEIASINPSNIDWENRLIRVKVKGNKEGLAPFGKGTERLLREWLSCYQVNGRLWDINYWGINIMLRRLKTRTGLPCNAHTFRRTMASILSKRGVDSIHIMRLGRWESIQMVDRYTKSVKFEDSLKLYSAIVT